MNRRKMLCSPKFFPKCLFHFGGQFQTLLKGRGKATFQSGQSLAILNRSHFKRSSVLQEARLAKERAYFHNYVSVLILCSTKKSPELSNITLNKKWSLCPTQSFW